jgi:hypothetical protein
MDDSPQQPEKKQEEGVGPFVGIVIVVILLALGGLYLIEQEIKMRQTPAPENLPAQTSQENS